MNALDSDVDEKKIDTGSSGLSGLRESQSQLYEEATTRRELWAWWLYNFAFEPISIVPWVTCDTDSL